MVEDVERTGEGFDTRQLERFLWSLRRLKRCTFVIAVDAESHLDYLKLYDTIELVPVVRVEHLERIFITAYNSWTTKYSDIDPIPNRHDSDPFEFRMSTPDDLMPSQLQASDWVQPQLALVSLLQTPRELKHMMRRVNRIWSNLHGEAELDHCIATCRCSNGTTYGAISTVAYDTCATASLIRKVCRPKVLTSKPKHTPWWRCET